MNIKFPNLQAKDIDVRVQSVINSKSGNIGAILLLYKDARCDMRLLDETVGCENWQRSHTVVNGNLFCTVSIYSEKRQEWIGKEDVGTESKTEKEKGQASDAFKRACFNWGIGRELYTAPFIWVNLNKDEYYKGTNGKFSTSSKTKFYVKNITISDDKEITDLTIVDISNKVRFSMTDKSNTAKQEPKKTTYDKKVEQQEKSSVLNSDGIPLKDLSVPELAKILGDKEQRHLHAEAKKFFHAKSAKK